MQRTDFSSHHTPVSVWKYLVHDFLEMACFLTNDQRDYLIEELGQEETQADFIRVHPSFSTEGRVIVVCEEGAANECWLYSPREKKLLKRKL